MKRGIAAWALLLVCVLAAAVIGLLAPLEAGKASREAAQLLPADAAWRAALPADPEAATAAYLARIPAAAQQRVNAYVDGENALQFWGWLAGLAVAGVLLFTGWSARLRDAIEARVRASGLRTALYGALYVLITSLLLAPLAVYSGFFREHAFGMSNQTLGAWVTDQAVGLAVSAVLGALAILVLYAVIRRAPRSWWAWGAGVATVFGALLLLIAPAVIDPLFNTYKPLAAGEVRDSILSMARANGVPANDVLEFDASRQTHRISANVSGIFGSAAIRLNDNLLKRTSLPEIRAVTGHEMGHYVLNHIYKALIIMGVVFVAVGLAVHHISSWLLARYGSRWGLRGLTDVASLPLLAAVFSTVMLFATPVTNNLTMSQEIEADIFGINVAREPDGFAEVALKLSEYRKVKPAAWEAFIFNTHPSAYDRVLMAMRWKAENRAVLSPTPATAPSAASSE